MELVPLAHEAFLGLAGCERLSGLSAPRFDMQTKKLVPLDPDAEDPEVAEVVSVFLGPHENLPETQEPNPASERRVRYDGIIQYGSDLLVVIESKLYANANASEQQALTSIRVVSPRRSHVLSLSGGRNSSTAGGIWWS